MDIVKSKQMPGDDLKRVMSDLAKNTDSATKLIIDDQGTPKSSTAAPPPPPVAPAPAPAPVAKTEPVPTPPPVAPAPAPEQHGDLDSIKLDAVEMLKPLIGGLDISPEEKFEAMIEIIRASDDQDMIAQAFDTAKSIENNDRRAQALIDVINEINYINKIKNS